MTRQRTAALFILLSTLTPILAQQPSAAPSSDPDVVCSAFNRCFDCVDAGCAWGIGTCFSSCAELTELPCYSIIEYDGSLNSAEEVCELQQKETNDAAICGTQTTCEACTGTTLSAVRQADEDEDSTTSTTCHWYEGSQVCSNVACNNQGCSSPYCPNTPEGECYFGADNCEDCLAIEGQTCSWSGGSCELNCLSDTACYSPRLFPDLSEQAICQIATNFEADSSLCLSQVDCTSCTEAVQSDGTNCEWYYDPPTRTGWCGMGGCDANGRCGLESCEGIPDQNNNFGPACAALEQFDPEDLTCQACLDANCAWTGASERCLENCDFLADAPCYTVGDSETVTSVCNQVENDIIDEELCNAATELGCADCTETLKSDRRSTCLWFQGSGSESGYCGAGAGCDESGNCGSSTCDDSEAGDPEVCDNYLTCQACLGSSPCVWDGDECFASCDDLSSGAICYSGSEPNFALQSNFAICRQAATASAGSGGDRDVATEDDSESSAFNSKNLLVAASMVAVAGLM